MFHRKRNLCNNKEATKCQVNQNFRNNTKGSDVNNFVIFDSTTAAGEDEVLQHKIMGTNETAHITLHSDGTVNFRARRLQNHKDG